MVSHYSKTEKYQRGLNDLNVFLMLENNPNQPDKFKPEPKEAKWGWALGVGIFSIIASIIALFVILDIVLFRKHCKFCQSNLRSFK